MRGDPPRRTPSSRATPRDAGDSAPDEAELPRALGGAPVKFGPYVLEARLAVGGTAEVYLARPADPAARPQRLIVKRLLPHFVLDSEGRTMFEREAALHAAVHHENVVTVFGSGTAGDGEPYLAMEYIEGVDGYRLFRRVAQAGRRLPLTVSVHIAREVLRALDSVHSARDASGAPMGIIHRDVTPSNLYLSNDGRVKLGDFGIARSTSRATLRNAQSAMLKGKFAYLAPEQVAGEPFNHRADLFAVAVVLAEAILGKQLFSGSGQLAVLLAIRDCRIDPLREARGGLPPGLFEALEKGLARDPATRFPTAAAFGDALERFDPSPAVSTTELGALVRWARAAPSTDTFAATRDAKRSAAADGESASAPREREDSASDATDEFTRTTGEYTAIDSFAETADGVRHGPWQFARMVEAIATGQLGRGDRVDYMGRGMAPIEEIEELARFLPARTLTTSQVPGIGSPDFVDDVSTTGLLGILLRVLECEETGVLFAEGGTDASGERGRKEIYFRAGRLHHVASNDASELFGEYLVRRKMISREELDFALAVLPRYAGRMGDTLISLGLASAVDIFRAIREQGKDRLASIFAWKSGTLTYYKNPAPQSVEFALDLELPPLMIAGLEAAQPADVPLQTFRPYLDVPLGPSTTTRPRLRALHWPPLLNRILELAQEPTPLRDILAYATRASEGVTANDVLRAVQILLAGKLVTWL